jgi:hypothetical protein
VAEGIEDKLRRTGFWRRSDFDGETTDILKSAVGGVEEGGVGKGTKRARHIRREGSVFEVEDRQDGGVNGESGD